LGQLTSFDGFMSQENSVEAKVIWNRAQGLEPDRDFSQLQVRI